MNNQKTFFVKKELKLHSDIDLELKPLKALRSRIKAFKKKQEDDLLEQYKNKGEKNEGGTQKQKNEFETDNQQDHQRQDFQKQDFNLQFENYSEDSKSKKKKPSYIFKGIKKFDKKLTSKQLIHGNLSEGPNPQEFQEKVAKCFEWRCDKMRKRQQIENQKWLKVINKEKNYILYKKGFKHMLDDLALTNVNINKFRRGLSIFEDNTLREQLLSETNAPLISIGQLRQKLQNVVLSHQPDGPQASIIQNNNQNESSIDFSMGIDAFVKTKSPFQNSQFETQRPFSQGFQNQSQFKNDLQSNMSNTQNSYLPDRGVQHSGVKTAPPTKIRKQECLNQNQNKIKAIVQNQLSQTNDSVLQQNGPDPESSLVYGSPDKLNSTQNKLFISDRLNISIMEGKNQLYSTTHALQSPIAAENTADSKSMMLMKKPNNLLTPEEQQKFYKQIEQCKNEITFPLNPSLFPQQLRIQQRQLLNQKAERLLNNSQQNFSSQLREKRQSFQNSILSGNNQKSQISNIINIQQNKQANFESNQVMNIIQQDNSVNTSLQQTNMKPSIKIDSPQKIMSSPNSKQDPFKKLSTFEQFCKNQNVFFSENDRIKHTIKNSKLQATNFCKSLQKGFKNLKNFEDHPNLKYVMQDEELPESILNQRFQKNQRNQAESFIINLQNQIKQSSQGSSNDLIQLIADRKRKIQEFIEQDQKNTFKRNQEFERFEKFLNGDKSKNLDKQNLKKFKSLNKNPVSMLSEALDQYKKDRIGSEDQLIKCIQKINLDKIILFREKKSVLWKNLEDQRQTTLEEALRKGKQTRHDINKKQKQAYDMVLQYMKERKSKPVMEEKQILDGIKIILENGWILETKEILQFFDSLNLKYKIQMSLDNLMFQEFIYLLCRLFEVDLTQIQDYFNL